MDLKLQNSLCGSFFCPCWKELSCFNMCGKIRSYYPRIFSKYTFSLLCISNRTQTSRSLIWGKSASPSCYWNISAVVCSCHFLFFIFFCLLPFRLFSTPDSLQLIGPEFRWLSELQISGFYTPNTTKDVIYLFLNSSMFSEERKFWITVASCAYFAMI